MKIKIETIKTLLLIAVIIAGCGGCSVKNREIVQELSNTTQEQKQEPNEFETLDGFTLQEEYRGFIINGENKKKEITPKHQSGNNSQSDTIKN